MPSKAQPIYPAEAKLLADFGERLRLARLRRNLSADTLAERSSIARMTLHRAENAVAQTTSDALAPVQIQSVDLHRWLWRLRASQSD